MAAEAHLAQPRAILRGHKAQVHAAAFCRRNERLLTGDADGFVVAWDLTIMRPRAVWQAHTTTVLGVAGWGDERVITHGRDNRLVVWKLGADDEAILSTSLPLDSVPETPPQPWMLHLLEINTMNFCTFSSCPATSDSVSSSTELLIAVPNTLASEAIDIFHLPSQARRHTVKLGDKNGMVMALSLFRESERLTLVAGYENGLAVAARLESDSTWITTYRAQCHSQPVLSLDVSPDRAYFLTSSADDVIAKHPMSTTTTVRGEIRSEPLKLIRTRHSGQQDLKIRSDGKIFATAGWDSKVRVYSAKTLKEVAVLKWHQVGCYATAFADVDGTAENDNSQGQMIEKLEGVRNADAKAGRQTQDNETVIAIIPKLVEVTVRDKRIEQAKTAHWLAAGSKDGKVSLWNVF